MSNGTLILLAIGAFLLLNGRGHTAAPSQSEESGNGQLPGVPTPEPTLPGEWFSMADGFQYRLIHAAGVHNGSTDIDIYERQGDSVHDYTRYPTGMAPHVKGSIV